MACLRLGLAAELFDVAVPLVLTIGGLVAVGALGLFKPKVA